MSTAEQEIGASRSRRQEQDMRVTDSDSVTRLNNLESPEKSRSRPTTSTKMSTTAFQANQPTLNRIQSFLMLIIIICNLLFIPNQVFGSHLETTPIKYRQDNDASLQLQLHQKSPRNHQQASIASTLIRPIECRNANNQSELGICMFSIDCMHNKGVALSVCKHNYFVGTCCRLPDHNNFVGIVYDLRDTEYGYLLEARRIAAGSSSPQAATIETSQHSTPALDVLTASSATASPPSGIIDLISDPESDSHNNNNQQLPHHSFASSSSSIAPVAYNNQQQTVEVDLVSPSKSDEKYVISSNSLFTSSAPNSNAGADLASKSPPGHQLGSESARNANSDPEMTFMQQPMRQQQQSIIRSEENPMLIELVSDQSHSSSTSPIQAEVARDSQDASTNNQSTAGYSYPSTFTTNNNEASTVSLSDHSPSNQSSPSQLMSLISSNVTPSTTGNIEVNKTSTSLSNDQEFTLSTVSQPMVEFVDLISSPSVSAAESKNPSYTTSSDQSTTANLSSSPMLTSAAPVQTTTPFTTSLSTAQLPVVSQSSPSSPAHLSSSTFTPSSTTAYSSSQASSSQSFDATTASTASNQQTPSGVQAEDAHHQNTLVSSVSPPAGPNQQFVTSGAPAFYSSSPRPAASNHHASQVANPSQTASFGYGQLYTSHHHSPNQNYLSSNSVSSNNYPYKSSGQLSSLMASTKTVSPSQQGNNLIPNLSHLQSAILSHIPFKLPSGLSNSLTSYLTAAMKPNGGRPLLASNTAVAHQFGQANQSSTTSSTTTSSSSITTTSKPSSSQQSTMSPIIRFPAPNNQLSSNSIDESSGNQTTTVASSNSSTSSLGQQLMGWPLNSLIGATANHFGFPHHHHSSASHHAAQSSRDAALQVCGRPQAGPAAQGPYSSSQAAALAVSSNAEAKKRVARIVGGNQSVFGQWPWIVSLRQWRKGAFLHKCGAALLNDNWAITAAHCVESVKPSDLLLRLGEFDVSNQNEPYPYVERRVKTIVAHPHFDPKTFEYDLALLKFAEPIRYERNILPVCVPSGNDSYVDRIATVIGWGRLYEDGPLPDIIQHVDVPIITNQECEHMYKKAGFVEEIPDIFICAGINKGGRDSCEGDSGGPLTMVDNDGRAYLVGIISWGIGCALPSQPGVYTRITTFASWINEIVNM